ncbi:hypothetical protein CPAR01_06632 [Colletotrichum paranaense]|uniref:Uncharacterized protein n=5 Tax=Colletotrichum acutatum species complex TaxID=2707335 RepID=A0A9Q0B3F0_9PEZI|nr:uncharacterized protein CCOS01_05434 [Colletotrichum costaricense]XP_060349778.1 uncharacterized protein CPAR01_06632 [Colletotrichum paranaense]XP_060379639.1 uncharacterized protein CTAM01_09747 [Colletotrichum tamarilloi]KAI3553520.1 hypothetical protein CABS02_06392 [Colletotrichum abscissum]KAK1479874.1 hypothetical protein CCUS01_00428 [Colletotrichum cuscutae]KAK1492796.1 hypothetical protein CTAM01_09747 [Colletotrichum tamarilloi]KAK1530331.1 hypothetical protein CCOS01_05434 [Col
MVERHWNTDTKSDGSELRGPKEAVFRQRFGCCRFRVPADCGPPIRALSALSLFNQTLNNDSKSGVALFHMGKRRAHSSRLQPESKVARYRLMDVFNHFTQILAIVSES